MRPHFYMDQLTPSDRRVIRRYYGYVAAFYCCVILASVAIARMTADHHSANGLGPAAEAVASDGGIVASGLPMKPTAPLAKR